MQMIIFLLAFLLLTSQGIALAETAVPKAHNTPYPLEVQYYANSHHVDYETAYFRLSIQEEIGKFDAKLKQDNHPNFAGLYIQHEPEYAIKVLYKSTDISEDNEFIQINKELLGTTKWKQYVRFIPVQFSLKKLENDFDEFSRILHQLNIKFDGELSVQRNLIGIGVIDSESLHAKLEKHKIPIPETIQIFQIPELSGPEPLPLVESFK